MDYFDYMKDALYILENTFKLTNTTFKMFISKGYNNTNSEIFI